MGVRPLERLEGVLAEGLPSPQSLGSRCDSGLTARDSCSSVPDSPGGSEVQGERRRRFTVNSSSTTSMTSVEELPSACAKTAAKRRFLIADGAPLTGPVDKRLGSLVSRGRISGPNRKFAVHSPSVPRTFVAAEASALPSASASASASALPPWSRSASAGDVSRMGRRGASPMEGVPPPASLPEEGLWHEGLSRESSMGRLLAEAEGGTALLEAMALPRDAPGAPPAPQPLRMLAGLLEAQRGSTGQKAAGQGGRPRGQAGRRRGRGVPWDGCLLGGDALARSWVPVRPPTASGVRPPARGSPLRPRGAPARRGPKPPLPTPLPTPLCPPPSARARRDLLQTEHAALKHLNAKLHELLKERRRDAARASAERQRAAATGVGLAESRDTDREHPLPLPQPSRC